MATSPSTNYSHLIFSISTSDAERLTISRRSRLSLSVASLVLLLLLFWPFVRLYLESFFNRAILAKKMAFLKAVACVAAIFLSVSHSQYLQDYQRYSFLLPSPPA